MIVNTRALRRSRRRLGDIVASIPTGATVAASALSRVAGQGELVNLSGAAHVYWITSPAIPTGDGVRLFAPGGTRCNPDILGGRVIGSGYCAIDPAAPSPFGAKVGMRPPNAIAKKVADQGQAFQLTEAATVYYGTGDPASLGYPADTRPYGAWMVHDMLKGSYICDNDPFGPDPAAGKKKYCFAVPHQAPEVAAPITYEQRLAAQQAAEERAQAAVQAQQDLYAAQLAIQQQQADSQAQLAQIARDAASQQAAAQRAAETYRAIQEQAAQQAADMAAQLAKIAYANEHDADLARAAAETAAQAESIRQATEAARKSEEDRARATLAAQAAALEMMRAQESYEAKLEVTKNAAGLQADLTAESAAGSVSSSGFDMKKILIFGGLGLAAVFVLMGD